MSYDWTSPAQYNPNAVVWGTTTLVADRIGGHWNPASQSAIATLTGNAGPGGDLTAGVATVTVAGANPFQFQTSDYLIPDSTLGAGMVSVGFPAVAQLAYLPGVTSVTVVVPFAYNDGCADQTATITFTAGVGLPGCNPATRKSATLDHDGDGIVDLCDLDSDSDGIPDSVEDTDHNINVTDDDIDGNILVTPTLGDGVANYLDLDSENDSGLDLFESGIANAVIVTLDVDRNGIIDLTNSVGLNGLTDSLETFPDSGVINFTIKNTDNDDKEDFVDAQSNGADLDMYLLGNESLDLLGAGHITPIIDVDADGIMDQVDTADTVRGAPGSPLTTW